MTNVSDHDRPEEPPAGAAEDPQSGVHGARRLPGVAIDSYSLEIEDADGMVGDRASQTAFRTILSRWRATLREAGVDPLGPQPTDDISKRALDRMANDDADAARLVDHATEEFSGRLAAVIGRFGSDPAWRGVERIVVGGGFKESDVGRRAIRRTAELLGEAGDGIELRPLHHEADDAGLIGWVHMAPAPERGERGLLAVDIGGTNVRCGIVAWNEADRADLAGVHIFKREKWCHADDEPAQNDLVEGIVRTLRDLIDHAAQHRFTLAPFIGVACPGIIRPDGTIDRGADNLPGEWNRASFHLPRRLQENIPHIGRADTVVRLHNDAVVQGLSELPFLRDVRRWAVLTIGTGLGNASFTRLD